MPRRCGTAGRRDTRPIRRAGATADVAAWRVPLTLRSAGHTTPGVSSPPRRRPSANDSKRPPMKKLLVLTATHGLALVVGFAAGIYVLPILIAPEGPSAVDVESVAGAAEYTAEFRRDLKGSDPLHWGEGKVTVGRKAVALRGRIAPGPDYKLYLVPEFVDTK